METIFIRTNTNIYDEACDVAHLYLEHDIHGIVYCGMVAGKQEPTNTIQYDYIQTQNGQSWLDENGYRRIEDLNIV
tara:strand:+ start:1223 stop:1450 length:228 start_codon:yes stop_codon:yes gene_type:complete